MGGRKRVEPEWDEAHFVLMLKSMQLLGHITTEQLSYFLRPDVLRGCRDLLTVLRMADQLGWPRARHI